MEPSFGLRWGLVRARLGPGWGLVGVWLGPGLGPGWGLVEAWLKPRWSAVTSQRPCAERVFTCRLVSKAWWIALLVSPQVPKVCLGFPLKSLSGQTRSATCKLIRGFHWPHVNRSYEKPWVPTFILALTFQILLWLVQRLGKHVA